MVKGGKIGGFSGGSLEHPRQWLGAPWAGLFPWECPAAQSRQARPEEAQELSWRAAKGGTLTAPLHLERRPHLLARSARQPVVLERQRSQRAVVAQPGGERLTTRVLDCVVLEIEISEHAVEREPLAEGARPAVL